MKFPQKLLLLLLFPFCVNAQQIVGVGFGASGGPFSVEDYGNVNFNYFATWRVLGAKLKADIMPATKFGVRTNLYFAGGFTSGTKRPFSAHILFGLGDFIAEKNSAVSYGRYYTFNRSSPIINLGAYYKLPNCKRILVGLEAYVWSDVKYYIHGYSNGITLTAIASINYRFNVIKEPEGNEKSKD